MERAFKHVALRALRHGAVAVQVAGPFAMLPVREMREAPVVDPAVHLGVARVARQLPREERGDDALTMRPLFQSGKRAKVAND
jgi:hypothetical protein